MNAVVYGAGKIGRGFIGMLFSQAGYTVTFIDIIPSLIDALNARASYPVRAIGGSETIVTHFTAISGDDMKATAEAIAAADIMATSVGAGSLAAIAPNIAEGLRRRSTPLDILLCENLMDADVVLRGHLAPLLSDAELQRTGLVEVSIGRTVPIQTPSMLDGDPLRLCVEAYAYLPVDSDAFKCPLPSIPGLIPHSPFGYYMERKLFLHNMGHALSAYLGSYAGHVLMSDALADADIRLMARRAMEESLRALCLKYGVDALVVLSYIDILLPRFACAELGDTCARVGSDPMRKLAAHDRLIGAAHACEAMGIVPAFICVGAAGALHQYLIDKDASAADALTQLTALDPDSTLAKHILALHALFTQHAPLSTIRAHAQSIHNAAAPDVI